MNKEEKIRQAILTLEVLIDCTKEDGTYYNAKKEWEALDVFRELQQENKELKERINTYENPEDLTLMFMYCEEKAKDKIKELHNKIDKAIEYINEIELDNYDTYIANILLDRNSDLLEILKDSDVDE